MGGYEGIYANLSLTALGAAVANAAKVNGALQTAIPTPMHGRKRLLTADCNDQTSPRPASGAAGQEQEETIQPGVRLCAD